MLNSYQPTYFRYSATSMLIAWPAQVAVEILHDVLRFKKIIEADDNLSVVQVVSSYQTLLVMYASEITAFEDQIAHLKSIYKERSLIKKPLRRLWEIPVCYDPVFGIDLAEIAQQKNKPMSDIIQWHSSAIYQVYFIGFLPGFLYLGGLDHRLMVPRKQTPRPRIEKGAVAIGGEQTGIYPSSSPGGWNIIGNSPLDFFNPKLKSPCFATAGDCVKFRMVNLETHQKIALAIKKGTYILENQVIDG